MGFIKDRFPRKSGKGGGGNMTGKGKKPSKSPFSSAVKGTFGVVPLGNYGWQVVSWSLSQLKGRVLSFHMFQGRHESGSPRALL